MTSPAASPAPSTGPPALAPALGPELRAARLRPGTLTAWRGPGRLQVGLDRRALVLDGLTAADELVLDALEGGCDGEHLRRMAVEHPGGPERLVQLLRALESAGALAPLPPPPEPQAEACVAVVGASRTGLAAALALAAAGTGTVLVEDDAPVGPGDTGRGGHPAASTGTSRGDSARHELARCSPGTRTRPSRPGPVRPDAVVLVTSGAHDARRAEALVREGVVHLGVVLHGRGAVVGPLVVPGRTTCLHCTDLHRTDRDPEWPRVLPQLASAPGGARRPEHPALAALVGALAAQQVLAHLQGGRPCALDATLEVDLDGAVGVRPWSPHPRCGCTWLPRA